MSEIVAHMVGFLSLIALAYLLGDAARASNEAYRRSLTEREREDYDREMDFLRLERNGCLTFQPHFVSVRLS